MKYHGEVYWKGYREPDGRVTDAVLTSDRVAIDYDDGTWQIQMTSTLVQGDRCEGSYSYKGYPESGTFALRMYRSGWDVVLFGTWDWPPSGSTGSWTFVLTPAQG